MKWMIPLFVILTIGCYQIPERFLSLNDHQPQVIYIEPNEEVLFEPNQFQFIVSEPLDRSTLTADSILLLEGDLPVSLLEDAKAFGRSLEKGDISSLPLQIDLDDSEQIVTIRFERELKPETPYVLVVTPHLLSKRRLSVAYFFKEYRIVFGENSESTPDISSKGNPHPSSHREGQASNQTEEKKEEAAISPEVSQNGTVVINEIFYDAVGSDTDGVLFVELFGTSGLDLGGYQILFLNGDDGRITDSITLPDGAVIGADGFFLVADAKTGNPTATTTPNADLIDEFDPQNGPDAAQLVSADGVLMDAIGYGVGIIQEGENGLAMYESSPAADVPSGHSLERVSPGQETDNNAADFVEREVPTPGR